MDFSQHGDYTLDWQDNILCIGYRGAWNDIAASNLHRDARQLWLAHDGEAWAMLSDARAWEGGTPECLALWWAFFEDGVRHGMVAVTDILPSAFHAKMVSPLAERASQLVHYRRSFDEAAARQWLGEQLAAHRHLGP